MSRNFDPTLCLVLGPDECADVVATALTAVADGVTMVQLRWKDAARDELVALARRLVVALPVPVLVNDDGAAAQAAGAAGCMSGKAT